MLPGTPQLDTEHEAVTAFVEVDEEGCYLDASPTALAAYGVTLEELRTHQVGDFAPEGLGPMHRALFRWVTATGQDFGGGSGTIVAPDGRATAVECTSISRVGDRYRIDMTITGPDSPPAYRRAVASILDAWRKAERDLESHPSDQDFELARTVAAALRDRYQAAVAEISERVNGEPRE